MKTLLVVDDEFGIAASLELVFGDEGYRVLTASNGRSGLLMLAETRPDVVLLNHMMPVLDGPGMLRAMRADAGLQDIPVIMMTALPETAVARDCPSYAAFLRKPFTGATAVETVARVLDTAVAGP